MNSAFLFQILPLDSESWGAERQGKLQASPSTVEPAPASEGGPLIGKRNDNFFDKTLSHKAQWDQDFVLYFDK